MTATLTTQTLFETPADTLLVRPANGGRPFLYFKPRGAETVWTATLEKMFGKQNTPAIRHQTLFAIGPHLIRAGDEVGEHVHYRQYQSVKPFNSGEWTRRLHKTSTGALKNIHARLLELSRKYIALDLIRRFFPARLEEVGIDEAWDTTFRRFLSLVEDENWFPLDFATLDTAYQTRLEDEEDDGDWLAEYMITIPLPAIAPVEEFLEDGYVRTLYGLFVNPWMLNGELMPYGIDEPQIINNDAIYGHIQALETELTGYEYPLNFLPDIARVYRRETGFEILDTPGIEGVSTPWGSVGAFTWEDDAFRLRTQWQLASPLVDRFNAFHYWMEEDERHFDRVVSLILQAGGVI